MSSFAKIIRCLKHLQMLSAVLYAWLRTPLQERNKFEDDPWSETLPHASSPFVETLFSDLGIFKLVCICFATDHDEGSLFKPVDLKLEAASESRRPLLKRSLLSSTLRVS